MSHIIKTYKVELTHNELTEIRELLDFQISFLRDSRGTESEVDKWEEEAESINDLAMSFADCSVDVVENVHPGMRLESSTGEAIARERDAEADLDATHKSN